MPKTLSPDHVDSVDPAKEWAPGWWKLARFWGIVSTVGIDTGLSLLTLYFGSWQSALGLFLGGMGVAAGSAIVRNPLKKHIECHEELHTIIHNTRDDFHAFLMLDGRNRSTVYERYCRFNRESADRIARYFQKLLGNSDIGCTIRLIDQHDGRYCYVTVARSAGFHSSRADQSEPLFAKEGMALAIRNKNTKGVFIVPDIEDAKKTGMWKESPNDKLGDIRSCMICPINRRENGEIVMLGILTVTAKHDCFRNPHTLPLKAFSDFLGLVYPIILQKTRSK